MIFGLNMAFMVEKIFSHMRCIHTYKINAMVEIIMRNHKEDVHNEKMMLSRITLCQRRRGVIDVITFINIDVQVTGPL